MFRLSVEKTKSILFAILFALLAYVFPVAAQQGPSNLNVSGVLFLPSGLPVTNTSVNFRLEIWDKTSTCMLYSEQHTLVDLSASKGGFSLAIGKGSAATNYLESSASFTAKLFENTGAIAGGWLNCPSGANLASGDERTVRVHYDLGGGFVAMSPDVPIASSAYAMIADTLQGKRPTDFVQLRDDMTYDLNQGNVENVFSSTNYARLLQLLNPSAAIGFAGQRLTNLADPSAAQDATTKNYADTKLAGQAIDLVDVAPGFGGGKVLTWDSASAKWVASVPTIAGSAGGDLSGSYPNPVVANLAIGTSKLADNAVTSAKISSTGIAPNQLVITDNVAGATLKYATCANNEILKYVTGTGWQCATAASLSAVLSVNGKTGVVVLNGADLGLGTASMRDVGVAATNVPELNGSGKLAVGVIPNFGGDLSGAYATAFVSGLQGRAVASAAPNANEVLRWNNSLTRWEPSALVDNVGITALTGDVSASGTGSVAATLTNGVVTTPKMFATPGANRLVATDGTTGATLVPFVCNLNESLQWTASGWACANPSTAFLGSNVIVDGGNARGANISIGTSDNFAINFKTNNTTKLTILPNGNVGIGETNPSNPLTVNGTMVTNNSITAGGNIFMLTGGTAADPALSWNFSTGLFYPAANVMAVSTNDLERLRISAAGNVGIGTTSPNRLLSVNGAINVAPSALPGSPVAGDLAIDSAASNSLKYHNGSTWVSLAVGGTGDFLANGAVPMTGQFRSIAGSAVAPGFSFVGDTDNGIFSPASDNLAIGTSGSEKMRILANGNVGIGTSNPGTTLDVVGRGSFSQLSGGLNSPLFIQNTHTGLAQDLGVGIDLRIQGIPTAMIGSAWSANGSTANTYLTFITRGSSATTERMRIDAAGNLGIGTTSPNRLLDVAGAIHVAPSALPGSPTAGDLAIDSGAGNSLKYHNGSNWVSLAIGGTGDFLANGSVAMTGPLRAVAGSAAAPGMTFVGDSANGIFAPATNAFGVSTSGQERIRVLANGNVGIGVSNPNVKLFVDGQIAASNASNYTQIGYGVAGQLSSSTTSESVISGGATFLNGLWRTNTNTASSMVAMNAGKIILSTNSGLATGSNFTPTPRMTVDDLGYVGIGTTAPVGILDVRAGTAAASTTGTNIYLAAQNAGAGGNNHGGDVILMPGNGTGTSNGGSLLIGSATAPSYVPQNSLYLLGGIFTGSDVVVFNGSNLAWGDSSSYIRGTTSAGTGTIVFGVSGAERMRVDSNGRIGIGVSAPSRTLDVAGPMRLTPSALPGTPGAGDLAIDSGAGNSLKYHNGSGWISLAVGGTGDFRANGSVPMTGNIQLNNNWLSNDGGNEGVHIDNAGNVSIGTTTSYATTLNVAGGITTATFNAPAYHGLLRLGSAVVANDGVGVISFRAPDGSGNVPSASIGAYVSPGATVSTGSVPADLTFATGSTSAIERMRVTSNGNIGIGTTAPGATLEVNGAVRVAQAIQNSGYTGNQLLLVNNQIDTYGVQLAAGDSLNLIADTDNNGTGDFNFRKGSGNSSAATPLMIIKSGGNVGIGTTAPNRLLEVAGPIRVSPTVLPGTPAAGDMAIDSGAGNSLKYHNGTSWISLGGGGSGDFMANGTVAMTGNLRLGSNYLSGDGDPEGVAVTSAGNVGVGTTSAASKLHVVASSGGTPSVTPTVLIQADISNATNATVNLAAGSTGFGSLRFGTRSSNAGEIRYNNVTEAMSFYSNSSEAMRINSSGQLGIGTTNPTAPLHVVGSNGAKLEFASTTLTLVPTYNSSGLGGQGQAGRIVGTVGNDFVLDLANNEASDVLAIRYSAANNGTPDTAGILLKGNGYVGIGTTAPGSRLDVNSSLSQTASGYYYGSSTAMDIAPTASSSAITYGGSFSRAYSSSSNLGSANIFGHEASAFLYNGTGTVSQLTGISSTSSNFASRNVTYLAGVDSRATSENSSTVGIAAGLTARVQQNGGTISSAYGVYIPQVQGATKWSVYASDAGAPSYFAGNLGIGITSPNRLLEVAGPIRITPTALPGTPGAGDVAIDSAAANTLKYYNGSSWISVGSSSGDFKADGSVPMTGQLRSLAGTSAAPGISFAGDADNGIFLPAADNVAIGTSGQERIRIAANGSVGIGNTNPGSDELLLFKDQNANTNFTIWNPNAGTSAYSSMFMVSGSNTVGITAFADSHGVNPGLGVISSNGAGSTGLRVQTNNAAPLTFGSNSVERIRIDSAGLVGIGTTTPARLLHVAGPMRLTPAALPGSPAAGDLAIDSAGGNALKYHNGSAWVSVGIGGDFMANGSVPMTGNLQLNGNYISKDGTNKGIYVDSFGYVALGHTAPNAPLDVTTQYANSAAQILVRNLVGGGTGASAGLILQTGTAGADAAVVYQIPGANWYSGANSALPGYRIGYTTGAPTIGSGDILTLKTTGEVGIGTTNPSFRLDVWQAAGPAARLLSTKSSNGLVTALNLDVQNSAGAGGSGLGNSIVFRGEVSNSTTGQDMTSINSLWTDATAGSPSAALTFGTVDLGSSLTERMRISSNGNVGIGVSNPAARLNIGATNAPSVRLNSNVTSDNGMYLGAYFNSANMSNALEWDGSNYQARATDTSMIQLSSGGLHVYTDTGLPGIRVPTERMVVDSSGRVGIGTTAPSRLLQVAGAVNISPTTNPASPTAGDLFIDSAGANTLKYYNGSAWVNVIGTGTVPVASGGTGNTSQAYVVLTDAATVTWNVAGLINNATVTLTGNRTLAFSGLQNGMSGTIIINQDATGGRTLALPAQCVNKVVSGGGGAIVLSNAGSATDILTFTYDGTNCYWTYGKNYN